MLEVNSGSSKLFRHHRLIGSLVCRTLKAHLFKDSVQTIASSRTFRERCKRTILIGSIQLTPWSFGVGYSIDVASFFEIAWINRSWLVMSFLRGDPGGIAAPTPAAVEAALRNVRQL